MHALLLVDLQNDFTPSGALPVPEGDTIVPLINELQPRFELVVATQDWHPAEHESFAVHHEGKSPGEVIQLHGLTQVLWPVHCVQESAGADFIPTLDRSRVAQIFRKGQNPRVDSYSGFFDNDRQSATGLESFLRERGVQEVSVVGLATDYCVKYTAADAARLGFGTTVLTDATRGVNLQRGDVEKALVDLREQGVRTITSAEL
jgi:nicotinamidase/pyrazinamidase